MEVKTFINFYEILKVGPAASHKAVARKFRQLARLYHPDNTSTGDRAKFDLVVKAYDAIKDPGKRERYHQEHHDLLPPLPASYDDDDGHEEDDADAGPAPHVERDPFIDDLGIERDLSIQNNLLTLLYVQRRRNTGRPGIGDAELARLSGCPYEHLDFHLWYLKAKGWIATGDDGLLAITVAGVDRAAQIFSGENAQRLITDQS